MMWLAKKQSRVGKKILLDAVRVSGSESGNCKKGTRGRGIYFESGQRSVAPKRQY